ncbi:LysR family transcriptional regulator [Amphritea balenae]|uniref:LysR family transcriptional regulator n=1 Tax=Amphritea balenae TaxID=452629 RepID=A0A3P1SUM7_9GAMM|nr:LysR family transcriptional regulator [Amphritea balenae]RRD00738.1 LysR family transcriptional regulator [Amphritea balenae]GGK68180.1 LysR family transcriptional regulator [Amphritea balenae]
MNTSDLSLFIRIAETGSISESAKQLSITAAAASLALKRLEKELDVQLFIRTTRQLRITTEGEQFLFHCRQALESIEQGRLSAHQVQGKVGGELKFSVSSDLGRNIVLPWIDEIMDQHPSLSIDLNVGDSLSNFFLDQVDVALRYGKPEDSTMVAFHIATINRITCASPGYIAEFGEPSHPEDLRKHSCLLYRLDSRLFDNWEYMDSSASYKIKVASNRISNDTDIVRRWAVAGKGIAHRSLIDIAADLRSGKLVQVLSDFQSPPVQLYLLCPGRKQVTPAVILFREMLREKCSELITAY